MRRMLRGLSIFAVFLLISLSIGPARPDLVEEIESHHTHLVLNQISTFKYLPLTDPSREFQWPCPGKLLSQYNPKKEPRPPRTV